MRVISQGARTRDASETKGDFVTSRRFFCTLIMAAGLAAGLAGCGEEKAGAKKAAPEKPAAAEGRPAKRPTVSVALWGGELQIGFTEFLCRSFPDVDFEFVLASNSTDYYRYRADRDDLPDIVTVRRFSLNDVLPLKDKLYDLSNTKAAASVYGSYLDTYTYADGTVNWLPSSAVIDSIIVNKTLLDEHGIALPKDYASFTEAVAKLEKAGVRGFLSDFGSDYTCLEVLQGFSIPVLNSFEGREWRRKYESGELRELSRSVWMPVFERFFDMKAKTGLGEAETRLRNEDAKQPYLKGELAMYRGTGRDMMTFPARRNDVGVMLPYFADDAGSGCYLTYPAFHVALSKRGTADPEHEKLVLEVLSAIISREGLASVSDGKSMVTYNRDVRLETDQSLANIGGAIAQNRIYIRLASNEMFRISKDVVQKILRDEIKTPEAAFEAFNRGMKTAQTEKAPIAATIERGYSTAFIRGVGNEAASAVVNTVRAEAGTDLALVQASYISPVYRGSYTAGDLAYLTKKDDSWPVLARLSGAQLFDLVAYLMKVKGTSGSVTNDSTLYVSSGFEMDIEKKDGGYTLKALTQNGRPLDRSKLYSVYMLSDGDYLIPTKLKALGVTEYELSRTRSNDWLARRLIEKGGRLEEPTRYLTLR